MSEVKRDVKIAAPSRERRLFALAGNETLVAGMLYHPGSDAFAAVVSAGRYVGPFRLESSLATTDWLPGISHLTLSMNGSALAYVEEQETGLFVVGSSRWGPYHWISAGPRFDAEGTSIAWIEDVAGGGQALWIDGVARARAAVGSWDPHEGSPLSLPFGDDRAGSNWPLIPSLEPVVRLGHWQVRIGDSMTAPVRWMSDAMSAEGDLVGFLVQDGACVYWREYHAGTSDDS